MIRVPYRWLPRTAWTNIRSMAGDVTHGISNIIRWTPVIWFDADFDWEYLGRILEYKFDRMAKHFEVDGVCGSKRDAHQLRVCRELVRRLRNDDYFENAGYSRDGWQKIPDNRKRQIAQHSSMMSKQDQRYLGTIIGKHLTGWWD